MGGVASLSNPVPVSVPVPAPVATGVPPARELPNRTRSATPSGGGGVSGFESGEEESVSMALLAPLVSPRTTLRVRGERELERTPVLKRMLALALLLVLVVVVARSIGVRGVTGESQRAHGDGDPRDPALIVSASRECSSCSGEDSASAPVPSMTLE